MNEPTDNGGPAFPVLELRHTCGDPIIEPSEGMSLRDYFAGKSISSAVEMALRLKAHRPTEYVDETAIAALSYQIADAMLLERSNPTQPNPTQPLDA